MVAAWGSSICASTGVAAIAIASAAIDPHDRRTPVFIHPLLSGPRCVGLLESVLSPKQSFATPLFANHCIDFPASVIEKTRRARINPAMGTQTFAWYEGRKVSGSGADWPKRHGEDEDDA
ncbi:hypothetical protein SPKIRA_11200 [Sphingomonas paucimobilis]|nr:hypothetical protein SPKIRA_11200 [Sphingomonas paucimobilis]